MYIKKNLARDIRGFVLVMEFVVGFAKLIQKCGELRLEYRFVG